MDNENKYFTKCFGKCAVCYHFELRLRGAWVYYPSLRASGGVILPLPPPRRGQRISKGGSEILNVVSNATRPEGLRLRSDRVRGRDVHCALPPCKKMLKIYILRNIFRPLFSNLCSFDKLEGGGRGTASRPLCPLMPLP